MADKPENPAQAAPQKTLKQFYREIQQWIDDGCPEHEIFVRNEGLCDLLRQWDNPQGELFKPLVASFTEAGLDDYFPFNDNDSYYSEHKTDSIYKNPARLAWIKEHSK